MSEVLEIIVDEIESCPLVYPQVQPLALAMAWKEVLAGNTFPKKLAKTVSDRYKLDPKKDLAAQIHIYVQCLRILQQVKALTGKRKPKKRDVKGLHIADLGCGTPEFSQQHDFGRLWEPWYCRVASEMEATVLGVDREPFIAQREDWTFEQVELLSGGQWVLEQASSRSHRVDIVNCDRVFWLDLDPNFAKEVNTKPGSLSITNAEAMAFYQDRIVHATMILGQAKSLLCVNEKMFWIQELRQEASAHRF